MHVVETGGRSCEVKLAVFHDYNARLDRGLAASVWSTAGQKSYYFNAHGRLGVQMPWPPEQYLAWLQQPDFNDYDIC